MLSTVPCVAGCSVYCIVLQCVARMPLQVEWIEYRVIDPTFPETIVVNTNHSSEQTDRE